MKKVNNKRNILLIWDRMGDYHRIRWQCLERKYTEAKVIAADLGANDTLYKWRNTKKTDNYYCLSQRPVATFDLFKRVYNFLRLLKNENIDVVVVSGYGRIEYLLFIILAKLLTKKVVIFAESWYRSRFLIDYIKGFFVRTFIDGFFVSGARAKNHFVSRLKVRESSVVEGYSVVDNNHFRCREALDASNEELRQLRPYILCVARYSEEKNLKFLIDAFEESTLFESHKLVIIGDGPQREYLERRVANMNNRVILTGWKTYEELPSWYCNASLFVLPSKFEPWGLVVNEAMSATLPVMASRECGCVEDLLVNGFGTIFDPVNRSDLMQMFNSYAMSSDEDINEQKRLAWEIISGYTPEAWAIKIQKLIANV